MKNFAYLLLFVSSPLFSQTLSSASLAQVKKATVFIEVKHNFVLTNDEFSSSGSGFFINDKGWIATNYHVIQSSLSDYSTTYPTRITRLKVIRNSGTSDYKTYTASVIAIDKENDLALLAVSDSTKFPFLDIETKEPAELQPVWVFGFPLGKEFTVLQRGPEISVNNGAVSALRHDDRNELKSVQVDAVINHGNSGGPLVNENGKAIGIVQSMMPGAKMNFAVAAHFLSALAKTVSEKFSFGMQTHLKIKTLPEDAEVFIGSNQLLTKNGFKDDYQPSGLYTMAVMKKGFTPCLKQVCFNGENYDDTVALLAERTLTVPARNIFSEEKKSSSANIQHEEILLKENFNDAKKFETWEQNTGGDTKRTWYLEEGKLNQYENNTTLHAIYLGEKEWENYTVRARVKITNEGGDKDADSRAGIIFRETEDGFYLLRIHKETNKAQLAYHSNEPFGWFILYEKKLDETIETGKWYELSASVFGNIISCAMNGKNLFNVNAAYSPKGRVGFYSVESAPVFDSLIVTKTKSISAPAAADSSSLVSFWFSDNFDLKSNWWEQYKIKEGTPGEEVISPLYMVDGSFAVTEETADEQCMEFTKYKLKDFSMNLIVSLDKGKDNAAFEIFLRSEGARKLALRFEKESTKLLLVEYDNGKEKVLKEKKLTEEVFGATAQLVVKLSGNAVFIGTTYSWFLAYESKNIPSAAGRIGFGLRNVRAAFHSLTLTSINDDLAAGKGKK
ncbi:MAG: trypsin-like peptidase domain-containing protein [Bacteroidetes bacterium]|nr:trypsin-like peptidase domain-containing protein [Bacteroidota bacterium]